MEPLKCVLCGQIALHELKGIYDETYIFDCPNCKSFSISDTFYKRINYETTPAERALLSGYIREVNDMGDKSKYIDSSSYKEFLNSFLVPRSIVDKANKLLLISTGIHRRLERQ